MASGTLVPFMSEVALPGDNFEIDLNVDIKTHPTIGPLFGSYKVQLDVFQCPVRLYNGKLHMNLLNIGLNMAQIKLPQVVLEAYGVTNGYKDNDQINPSSLFSYLNMRGLGIHENGISGVKREFNAIPYLAYWDIYKNYYANKQEEYGAYIHNDQNEILNVIDTFEINSGSTIYDITDTAATNVITFNQFTTAGIIFTGEDEPLASSIYLVWNQGGSDVTKAITEIWNDVTWNGATKELFCDGGNFFDGSVPTDIKNYVYDGSTVPAEKRPKVVTFPLVNIDTMRENILVDTMNAGAFKITHESIAPYGPPLLQGDLDKFPITSTQEALGIKTYQSDLFNNWISTEWIDGDNGINAVTAVDTSSGEFTIDTLQLSRKVYDMLNRIAVSGGSYDDWLNAVYTHERTRAQENPVYVGGLIKELGFQEVVSNAAATNEDTTQPLGTLAGRGVLTGKNKGGKISVKVDEPSYIMGIISLTPRIDYSQGNKWDVNLKTLDDFHKPALDEIGFQDLITDQMAWWDTRIVGGEPVYKSAGKQPAWINYMTNVNQVRGNFASQNEQMYMTLNRRYEQDEELNIKDLTTYIDPSKYNNIFADTRLDAQNFWAQIAVNIEARRKMSSKLMPNL